MRVKKFPQSVGQGGGDARRGQCPFFLWLSSQKGLSTPARTSVSDRLVTRAAGACLFSDYDRRRSLARQTGHARGQASIQPSRVAAIEQFGGIPLLSQGRGTAISRTARHLQKQASYNRCEQARRE